MPVGNGAGNSRRLAQRYGVIWGISAGVVMFVFGIRPLFSMGGPDTWLNITMDIIGVLGFFGLLPLSVLAIFKPRTAAYGITLCAVFLAIDVTLGFLEPAADLVVSRLVLLLFALGLLASPIGVAYLLFNASRPDR